MTMLEDLRVDLACALRWAARYDLHEGVCNHFSIAIPDDDGVVRGNLFLINPYGYHWSEITASSLVLCNKDGDVIEGENEVEQTAFFIHSQVHLNAPGATAVLHTHQPHRLGDHLAAVVLSCVDACAQLFAVRALDTLLHAECVSKMP